MPLGGYVMCTLSKNVACPRSEISNAVCRSLMRVVRCGVSADILQCRPLKAKSSSHQQKKKVTPRHALCSMCVRWSRSIEPQLASWVCRLLLGAWGQGSMAPGRTRRTQGLRRYQTQRGSPDAEWCSGRIIVVRTQPDRIVE